MAIDEAWGNHRSHEDHLAEGALTNVVKLRYNYLANAQMTWTRLSVLPRRNLMHRKDPVTATTCIGKTPPPAR
jgi:hypothetical protein